MNWIANCTFSALKPQNCFIRPFSCHNYLYLQKFVKHKINRFCNHVQVQTTLGFEMFTVILVDDKDNVRVSLL